MIILIKTTKRSQKCIVVFQPAHYLTSYEYSEYDMQIFYILILV